MPRPHLRLALLLASFPFIACTCEPLGVDKLRFACSADSDCEAPQQCLDGECRPAGAQGGGTGTGGGDAALTRVTPSMSALPDELAVSDRQE